MLQEAPLSKCPSGLPDGTDPTQPLGDLVPTGERLAHQTPLSMQAPAASRVVAQLCLKSPTRMRGSFADFNSRFDERLRRMGFGPRPAI
jgi:hypothetical protein